MIQRVTTLFALLLASPLAAATPFPLGVYVGNPNGNDAAAMASFKAQFDKFSTIMGARSKFFSSFTDFGKDPSQWASNAGWSAWSARQSGDAYVGPGSGAIPIVGVGIVSNAGGWAKVDTFYLDTISGKYDSVWTGIVKAWASSGYTEAHFRLGYEMDGNFMPWAPANNATSRANFVKAFQRIAGLMHAAGKTAGMKTVIHWNPAQISWTGYDVATLYPGDAYVDVIGTDAYSPTYPLDRTDWCAAGKPQVPDLKTWAAKDCNRLHFWQYPNATTYSQTPKLGNWGWSLPYAIELARLHDKPISIDESGTGPGPNDPADDGAFPAWLAKTLKASGLHVTNVVVWPTRQSDGNWGWLDGEKPLAQAAWVQGFGSAATRK